MDKLIRIGTRESQLAVWQATQVKDLLADSGYSSELVFIKSEGDIDLQTPLYEMGVQGIFTKSLDIALLQNKIDLAVHSMKDVPTRLAEGIVQAAVMKRGSWKDLLVLKKTEKDTNRQTGLTPAALTTLVEENERFIVATSSIRRKAQWLNRYPRHRIENLRGNVNTRLRKLQENDWNGAIFAAAGLERTGLRPAHSIELEWMLPAPAQGAVVVVCNKKDTFVQDACHHFNDPLTELCTQIEKDFLRELLGGCSTPISALATVDNERIFFKGNILSIDGKEKVGIEKDVTRDEAAGLGKQAATELLANGGKKIADSIRDAGK